MHTSSSQICKRSHLQAAQPRGSLMDGCKHPSWRMLIGLSGYSLAACWSPVNLPSRWLLMTPRNTVIISQHHLLGWVHQRPPEEQRAGLVHEVFSGDSPVFIILVEHTDCVPSFGHIRWLEMSFLHAATLSITANRTLTEFWLRLVTWTPALVPLSHTVLTKTAPILAARRVHR